MYNSTLCNTFETIVFYELVGLQPDLYKVEIECFFSLKTQNKEVKVLF